MKIFRKVEGKIVSMDTDAHQKMQYETKSSALPVENAMVIPEGVDPVFGKLEYYVDTPESEENTEERKKELKNEAKKFFRY